MATSARWNRSTSPLSPHHDSARLHTLQLLLCGKLDELFGELGVGLTRMGKMYCGCCPVHGGDNPNAFNIYPAGDSVPGYWKCYTGHCHETFKRTVLGFTRGVLSNRKYGWTTFRDPREQASQHTVSFRETVQWCCDFLGVSLQGIEVNLAEVEKRLFTSGVSVLTRTSPPPKGASRAEVRSRLKIPARYFQTRGWSAETLNRYDVGYCDNAKSPLFERVVVPVFDPDYRVVVGYTGRSTHEKCERCKTFHSPGRECPAAGEKDRFSKWRHHGFSAESVLYNYWFARRHIRLTGVVFLCEGPGDVWRLEEAGIHSGVAMFGASLSDFQQILIETSGAAACVVLTNMDGPGRAAAEILKKQLGRCVRLYVPELPAKDLGEMRPDAVSELLLPLLNRLRRRG